MLPTGGLGIGVDRLVMRLTDALSIRDVLFVSADEGAGSSRCAGGSRLDGVCPPCGQCRGDGAFLCITVDAKTVPNMVSGHRHEALNPCLVTRALRTLLLEVDGHSGRYGVDFSHFEHLADTAALIMSKSQLILLILSR